MSKNTTTELHSLSKSTHTLVLVSYHSGHKLHIYYCLMSAPAVFSQHEICCKCGSSVQNPY